jgi:hypothetical protein
MSYGVTPHLRAPLQKAAGGGPRLPSVAVPRYPFRDTREASDVLSGIKVIGSLLSGIEVIGGLARVRLIAKINAVAWPISIAGGLAPSPHSSQAARPVAARSRARMGNKSG